MRIDGAFRSASTPGVAGEAARAGRRLRGLLRGSALGTLALAVSLGGCGVVPKDGPEGIRVKAGADVTVQDTSQLNYAVVRMSPVALKAANALTQARNPSFASLGGSSAPTDVRIAVGDVVSVTVFEASSGGLFIPREAGSRPGNFINMPNVEVDATGSIAVPYAGPVRAAGLTPRQVGDEIASRIQNRAIEPQVIVSINARRGNDVSVLGEAAQPLRFSLDPGGLRVLAAIARAGGPRYPAFETIVTIQRGNRTTQSVLSTVVRNPAQNVQLQPGDVVYLSREQKTYLTLGATPSPGSIGGTNNRRFSFENDNMTLAEATAKAGGLETTRADSRAVFLYRLETRAVLTALGVDTRRYAGDQIPTVYTVDFSRPDAFFLASNFYMRDKDIIFVAESASYDLQKLFSVIGSVSSVASAAALSVN